MNKKFTAFFTSYGMTVNGNFAYGVVRGYETNAMIANMDNVAPLRFHVSFYATDDQKRIIESSIRNLALKYFVMQFTPYGLSFGLRGMTDGSLLKRLPAVLDAIYGILSQGGALNSEYCPVCGNPLDPFGTKKCNIDGYTISLDENCVNTINSVISAENLEFNNAPNNYLRGFVGAFIGALAGAAISILLYLVGFVASISAFVAITLGALLYQKFGGKPNKMMIVIVSLTSMILLAATVPAIYIVASGIAAHAEGVSLPAIEVFRQLMQESEEFARMFYADLALVIFFSILGAGYEIYKLSKKIKRRKNI